jgi:hypothetical protein
VRRESDQIDHLQGGGISRPEGGSCIVSASHLIENKPHGCPGKRRQGVQRDTQSVSFLE